jgi:hypothetical protein
MHLYQNHQTQLLHTFVPISGSHFLPSSGYSPHHGICFKYIKKFHTQFTYAHNYYHLC